MDQWANLLGCFSLSLNKYVYSTYYCQVLFHNTQFSSVAQLCPNLFDPVHCIMPGFPVHHQLLEPGACSNSCPSSQWCHPPISSCRPPSLPVFYLSQHHGHPMSQFFASGGQSIGASASASVLPMNVQDWSLGWTGWISLQCNRLWGVFSNTTVQKHQFFGAQLSLWSNSHIHTRLLENLSFDWMDLWWQSNISAF